ncbi:MAG TPA: exodeoxyribonuclease III [Acidimicrobiales bacterium]|jgi:exodeoxyribonuclease-3|nr:exodeoxyribonuclease III [Acidimicrobiales bacterium]
MRIATWNVNSLKARMPAVEQWLGTVQPDVLCMQETKLADDAFPDKFFADLGYETAHHGNGAWNGVAICSRVGIDEVVRGFEGDAAEAESRSIQALCDDVTVVCVYVPNGRVVASTHYEAKLEWLHRLVPFVAETTRQSESVVVCGDFNVAPTDLDVYDPSAFVGDTHVTPAERQALGDLLDLGLVDVVRALYPNTGGLFSWWDYRRGDFHNGRGMRIDLMLMTAALADRASWALIDRNARKGQGSKTAPQPSDHSPVVVELG